MRQLKSQLDAATEALKNETQNLIRIAYSEYQAALTKEQSLQRLLDAQKNEAYKANSNSVIYNSMKIELENKKSLLESLSKRQSETDVSSRLKGLEALNVWIVDKADYPLNPTSPNKRKNVLIGILLGLAGGVGLALGLEYLDHTVKTSKDVTNAIGVPTLGSVPGLDQETRKTGPKAELAKLMSMLRSKSEAPEAKTRRKSKRREAPLEPRWLADEQDEWQRTGRQDRAHRHARAPIDPGRELPLDQNDFARILPARAGSRPSCSRARWRRRANPPPSPTWVSPWRKPTSESSSWIPTCGSLGRPGSSG